MPSVVPATPRHVGLIYRESYAVWGSGLSYDDYLGLWEDVAATAWARRHVTFLCLEGDDGEVLSSLKLYRPRVSLDGRPHAAVVIGAVYTPAARRGRGAASDLMRRVLDEERRRGTKLALLFSDIGGRLYGDLGFRELPAREQWGRLRASRSLDAGWSLRPATAGDRPAIAEAHANFCSRRPLAVLRDEEHWEFLRVRSDSFFARLGDRRLSPRVDVVERDGHFAGYLVAVCGRGEWTVREVGARDGSAAAQASVLRAGAAWAWGAGLRRLYGWFPPDVVPCLADLRLQQRPRRRAVPMVRGLAAEVDVEALATAAAGFLPFQDQF